MFVEMLDQEARQATFTSFFGAVEKALVQVFGKSPDEATRSIAALRVRFADASLHEQNLLLHNDPLSLASDLAEVAWADVDMELVEVFQNGRQPVFTRN